MLHVIFKKMRGPGVVHEIDQSALLAIAQQVERIFSGQFFQALEHAVIDNIVPDFPLINKSYNLSYSGADL